MPRSITIISSSYLPEGNATAKRISAMADHLARRHWKVSVVTQLPHHPQNQIFENYNVQTPFRSCEDGVTIIRLRPWLVPKHNFFMRILSEVRFAILSLRYVHKSNSDLVFATSPYMFLGFIFLLFSRLFSKGFIWEVRDLTWEYPRASGKRTFGLDYIIKGLMLFTARHSDALVTATEGQIPYFNRRPKLSKVIPNGITEKLLEELKPLASKPFPVKKPYTIVYAGLFGYVHGLSTILVDVAKQHHDCHFIFVGDGPERDLLNDLAEKHNLVNVFFKAYLPFDQLMEVYSEADILISHVRKNPIYTFTQPAKIWEYMATGKPVVHAGEGEVISLMEEHNIAITIPPENPQCFSNAIQHLIDNPEWAKELGLRGQTFVEHHRNRSKIMVQLEELLLEAYPK